MTFTKVLLSTLSICHFGQNQRRKTDLRGSIHLFIHIFVTSPRMDMDMFVCIYVIIISNNNERTQREADHLLATCKAKQNNVKQSKANANEEETTQLVACHLLIHSHSHTNFQQEKSEAVGRLKRLDYTRKKKNTHTQEQKQAIIVTIVESFAPAIVITFPQLSASIHC